MIFSFNEGKLRIIYIVDYIDNLNVHMCKFVDCVTVFDSLTDIMT